MACLYFSWHIFNFLHIWSLFCYKASGEWTWMAPSAWVFSSSWLTYVTPGKVHYFLLWKMLFFQTINLLYILVNLENRHILKWHHIEIETGPYWHRPHISNANQNCLILNIFSILSAKIIFWTEHIFVELSLDLKEILINLNSYLLLRTLWNKFTFTSKTSKTSGWKLIR